MHKSKRLLSLLFLFTLAISRAANAGERVAILVDGNDYKLDGISGYLKQSTDEAASIYSKNGYRVIRIEAAKGMGAEDFRNAISGLKDIDELSVDFFTHGSITNDSFISDKPLTGKDLKRFPKSYLRPDEIEMKYGEEEIKNPVRYAFAMLTRGKKFDPNADWIGIGDLYSAIKTLRTTNPGAKVNIIALSCFGGNATRGLQDLPGVQVFSGSAGSQTAQSFPSDKTLLEVARNRASNDRSEYTGAQLDSVSDLDVKQVASFANLILQELKRGEPYLSAHSKAREKYLQLKLSTIDGTNMVGGVSEPTSFLVRPQSSVELLLADQCLGRPPRTEVEVTCLSSPEVFEDVTNQTSNLSQPVLIDYLSSQISEDTQYLEVTRTFFSCDDNLRSKEEKIRKSALIAARKQFQQELNSFDKSDFERLAQKLEAKLKAVQNAKTPEELLSLIDNTFNSGQAEYGILREEAESKRNESIESSKKMLKPELEQRINQLRDGDPIKKLRANSDRYFKNYFNESSTYSDSLASPMEWDLSEFWDYSVNSFAPYEYPADTRRKKLLAIAKLFINEKCPSSSLLRTSPDQLKEARLDQLKCIEEKTGDDAMLRLHALDLASPKVKAKDREQICKLISQEKSKNEKLAQCLANPSKLGNAHFWNQMNGLYSQGQTTVVNK